MRKTGCDPDNEQLKKNVSCTGQKNSYFKNNHCLHNLYLGSNAILTEWKCRVALMAGASLQTTSMKVSQ